MPLTSVRRRMSSSLRNKRPKLASAAASPSSTASPIVFALPARPTMSLKSLRERSLLPAQLASANSVAANSLCVIPYLPNISATASWESSRTLERILSSLSLTISFFCNGAEKSFTSLPVTPSMNFSFLSLTASITSPVDAVTRSKVLKLSEGATKSRSRSSSSFNRPA